MEQTYAHNGSRIAMVLGENDVKTVDGEEVINKTPHKIAWVYSPPEVRKLGQIKYLMRKLLADTDRDVITDPLRPEKTRDDNTTTVEGLQKLFTDFGFEVQPNHKNLIMRWRKS